MDYDEALHVLGVEDGASEEDIKLAYREMAQILHPDRYTGNEKLERRATEQFKRLNSARDTLLSSGRTHQRGAKGTAARGAGLDKAASLKARLNGIIAARENLVTYRDTLDEGKRYGAIGMGAGALLLIFSIRFARTLFFLPIIGIAILSWGVTKVINAYSERKIVDEKLAELETQKKEITDELEAL